eukprot:TRINITY_DN1322_c0_g1_i1.p2 TRINITY_DN1322_c0_g1~~TRINITY_DN1322_c0_g1_i1.p2  ORF type:complete len:52 (+),score=5.18 TRINITY_DN1322_c0_g1_i1:580-735(+)
MQQLSYGKLISNRGFAFLYQNEYLCGNYQSILVWKVTNIQCVDTGFFRTSH